MSKNVRPFTEEEDQFLRDYPNEPIKDLANALNRSYQSITSRRSRLKISTKESVQEGYKKCSRCHKILPINKFYRNQGWCKNCTKEYKQQVTVLQSAKARKRFIDEIKDKMFTCSRCKKEKRGSEFSIQKKKNKTNDYSYYRNGYCKKCCSQINKEFELERTKNNIY